MNTQMEATSKSTSSRNTQPSSPFSDAEHIQCLSQITPIAVGLSKITALLRGVDALTQYSGGRTRRKFRARTLEEESVVHRLHHLRRVEHKGGTINTRVGLGRGWEKFDQGVPVDSPRRKFRV